MRKKNLLILVPISLIILLIYFSFGKMITQIVNEILVPKNHIGIKVKNKSDENIKKIYFFVGKQLSDSISNLEAGKSKTKNVVWQKGEGLFHLQVFFQSGKMIFSTEEYAEQGYFVKKEIRNDTILTDYNLSQKNTPPTHGKACSVFEGK